MSTEYGYRYKKPEPIEIDKNHSEIGPKELSGYAINKEKEDVLSFLPGMIRNF